MYRITDTLYILVSISFIVQQRFGECNSKSHGVGGGGGGGGAGDGKDHSAHKSKPIHTDPLIVETKSGLIRGYSKMVLSHEVHAFTGIPFAKPPVGPLRFRKPVPVEPWEGILNATKLPYSCYQENYDYFPGFEGEAMWNANTELSEDCLFLSIWVPQKLRLRHHGERDPAKRPKTPVFVWIYGGGYISGTSTLDVYTSDIMAAYNNAIVAAMQYRIGAFGFLYLSPELPNSNGDAPGNMGLYDQILAIQWLKENIHAFGGDPENITLFGESAGAGSVSVHLVSPLTKGLVRRGILQSGTMNAPWSYMTGEKAVKIGLTLIDDCGCNSSEIVENPSRVMSCMRSVDAKTISKRQWNSYWGILGFPSAPTIDGILLTKDPMEMVREGNYSDVEVIIGSNLNEGTFFLLYDFIDYFKRDEPTPLEREKFLEIVDTIFKDFNQLEKDAIVFQYTDWENMHDWENMDTRYAHQKLLGDLVGDYFFVCPTNLFANVFAEQGGSVYYYFFTQRTSSHLWDKWMGVLHGDEVAYVFGQPLNISVPYNARERDLSMRIMQAFSLFAVSGKPLENEAEWPKYTKENPVYYIYDAAYDAVERRIGKGPRSTMCEFWNGFMPEIRTYTSSLSVNCGVANVWKFENGNGNENNENGTAPIGAAERPRANWSFVLIVSVFLSVLLLTEVPF